MFYIIIVCNAYTDGEACDSILDLGFLVDVDPQSHSERENVRDFIKLITNGFSVSLLSTRIGLIITGTRLDLKLSFRDTDSYDTIFNSLKDLRIGKKRRKLSDSLTFASEELFNRDAGSRNVPGVLVIITDRDPIIGAEIRDLVSAVQRSEGAGASVVVVHIGSDRKTKDRGWLYQLVEESKVFATKSYSELGLYNRDLRRSICQIGSKQKHAH